MVFPVTSGERVIGLLAATHSDHPLYSHEIQDIMAFCRPYAIRLEAALLFSDIRFSATAEERRRLARDIHDGIAQELASLGYAIDALISSAASPQIVDELREIRHEVSRIVTELRLSIFDLRLEVSLGTGLNVALSEYVHNLVVEPGTEVHLALQESPERLGPDTEAELLRIAQEALTNARRHGRPKNIWVTSRINTPHFELIVEDDGRGMQASRSDSYGLKIMRERAERIGATVAITPRPGGGTVVHTRNAPSRLGLGN
jgi:signal transduction histidine kinase